MLVLLGDSTAVGIGDPVPGGWRGFGPLLSSAFGGDYRNFALSGARIADVRRIQLPAAMRLRPKAAVVVAGVNDTLRSDFDTGQLHSDLDHIVGELSAAGTSVVTVRFHDQGRVFKLPGRLRRVLGERITVLNEIIDVVVARHDAKCVDLNLLPGAYELAAWAVDRLHPSELGHRMLAKAFAQKLQEQGHEVGPVSLECGGGRELTMAHHVAWLVVKGIPWLWRRGRDLVPLLWSHDIPGEARSAVTGGGGGAVAGEALRADTGRG